MFPVAFWKPSAAAVFDPATLPLSMWHSAKKAAYSGTPPWAGNASTGGSGSVTAVTAGADPTTGSSLNGNVTTAFNGSQWLTESANNNVIFASSSGSVAFLFNASSIPTTTGLLYGDGSFLSDPGDADTTFGLTSAGLSAALNTASGYIRANVTFSTTGSWHLFQAKWDGTNLKARVDSGSWSAGTVACGPVVFAVPATPTLGESYAGGARYSGLIAEAIASATTISDANFDNIKSYVNSTYGLAL